MELYHGTDADIKKFVIDNIGAEEAIDHNGPGIYLTTDRDEADRYGNNLYKLTLDDIKLVMPKSNKPNVQMLVKLIKSAPNWQVGASNWSEDANSGAIQAAKSAIEYNDSAKDVYLQIWIDFYRYSPVDFAINMKNSGYDGLLVDTQTSAKHIILYNVAKIKDMKKMKNSEEPEKIREIVKQAILKELKKKKRKKYNRNYFPVFSRFPSGIGFGGNFGADFGDYGDFGGDSGGGDGGGA